MRRVAALLLLAAACPGAVPKLRFIASEIANLTFELDAMAGLSPADGEAYRALWSRELRWDREDDWQLDRWKRARRLPEEESPLAPVAWPPNYPSYYGRALGVDGEVRIAGLRARSADDYGKQLRRLTGRDGADALVSVVRHFAPRFHEFWEREGRRLTEPRAREFEQLSTQNAIPELARQLAAFTGASPKELRFYLIAHPARFGRQAMATMTRGHAPVELLDDELPRERLSVIVHEMTHDLYDRAPAGRQLALIEEFRRRPQPWRMAAYSYLNEALATAAQVLVERRLRSDADFVRWAANPENIYSQPWIAALGAATHPLLERFLRDGRGLFDGFAGSYLVAAERALGGRLEHPHFRLASRVVLMENRRLRSAARRLRERVPSIAEMSGWQELARFPEAPVVLLTLDEERDALLRRVGPGRDVTVISGATPIAVEASVERLASQPY